MNFSTYEFDSSCLNEIKKKLSALFRIKRILEHLEHFTETKRGNDVKNGFRTFPERDWVNLIVFSLSVIVKGVLVKVKAQVKTHSK